MSQFKIFTSIRLIENFRKPNPAEKILTFAILVTNNSTIHSSVTYEQECHINKTSDKSGILEFDDDQQKSFKIANQGISFMIDNEWKPLLQFKATELLEKITPENFLLYDSKNYKFLLSQNKSDSTFFDTQTPYLIFEESFVEEFFKNIREVISSDLFHKLQESDTMEIYNI